MFDMWDACAAAGAVGILLGAWLLLGWGGVALAVGLGLLAVGVLGVRNAPRVKRGHNETNRA